MTLQAMKGRDPLFAVGEKVGESDLIYANREAVPEGRQQTYGRSEACEGPPPQLHRRAFTTPTFGSQRRERQILQRKRRLPATLV